MLQFCTTVQHCSTLFLISWSHLFYLANVGCLSTSFPDPVSSHLGAGQRCGLRQSRACVLYKIHLKLFLVTLQQIYFCPADGLACKLQMSR